jgi:hypothetical protein
MITESVAEDEEGVSMDIDNYDGPTHNNKKINYESQDIKKAIISDKPTS